MDGAGGHLSGLFVSSFLVCTILSPDKRIQRGHFSLSLTATRSFCLFPFSRALHSYLSDISFHIQSTSPPTHPQLPPLPSFPTVYSQQTSVVEHSLLSSRQNCHGRSADACVGVRRQAQAVQCLSPDIMVHTSDVAAGPSESKCFPPIPAGNACPTDFSRRKGARRTLAVAVVGCLCLGWASAFRPSFPGQMGA